MTDEMTGVMPPMWAGGRRTRHPSGRHVRMSLRLSPAENADVRRLALAAGVSPQRFLLEAALHGGPVTVAERRRRVDELGFITRQLVGLATNVNQLAKAANRTGQVPAGTGQALVAIERLAAQVGRATDRVSGAFDPFRP